MTVAPSESAGVRGEASKSGPLGSPTSPGRVLVVEDQAFDRDLLVRVLRGDGHQVTTAADGEEGLAALDHTKPDVVLCDVVMPQMNGFDFCRAVKSRALYVPVLLVTGRTDPEDLLAGFEAGADDYIAKPIEFEELKARVRNMVRISQLLAGNQQLEEEVRQLSGFGNIVAASASFRRILELVSQVAAVDSTVLIMGESGTGKELIARAIHDQSPRRSGPFIAASCGALPETLLESELFGHEDGAFTGARGRKIGRFERAQRGTIFLDEISEIPPKAQVDLLRVLQERKLERLGGQETVDLDVRVLAATNRDLEQCVRERTFREDLLYRLNVIAIRIPPLRERPDDIAPLAYHFLKRFADRTGKPIDNFSTAALNALTRYRWPGNVRQLENIIERAVVLARLKTIDIGDLPESMVQNATTKPTTDNLAALERDTIARVLAETEWNLLQAARRLGISRTTLYSKIRKHNLDQQAPRI